MTTGSREKTCFSDENIFLYSSYHVSHDEMKRNYSEIIKGITTLTWILNSKKILMQMVDVVQY